MAVITSSVKRVSNSFTRPSDTTAYASGDLVANSTTAVSVIPIALSVGRGGFRIPMVRLEKNNNTTSNATFRIHFFENTPTVSNGDNGALLVNLAGYVGYVDLPTMVAASNGAYTVSDSAGASMFNGTTSDGLYGYASSTYIYALIEARAAYTPTSGGILTLTANVEKF